MKTVLKKADLIAGLVYAKEVCSKKLSNPILENILLSSLDNGIVDISATDLTVGFKYTADNLSGEILSNGCVLVNAEKLTNVIANADADDLISIELVDSQLVVKVGNKAKYKLNTCAVDDYPTLPDLGNELRRIRIQGCLLAQLLSGCIPFICEDTTRPNLCGVNIEIAEDKDELRCVATDGHRVALFDTLDFNTDSKCVSYIAPTKGIKLIANVLANCSGEIDVILTTSFLVIKVNKIEIRVRLVDGIYPQYRRILPSNSTTSIIVNTDELRKVIKRVNVINTEDKPYGVINVTDNIFECSAVSSHYGDADESLPCRQSNEVGIKLGWNLKYAIEILVNMNYAENVDIKFTTDNGAVVFSNEIAKHMVVLMPVRV